jgi:hypothetical protein
MAWSAPTLAAGTPLLPAAEHKFKVSVHNKFADVMARAELSKTDSAA